MRRKHIAKLKRHQQRVLSETLREPICDLEDLHVQKPLPKPGEWLYIYDEHGETFREYKKSKPHKAAKDSQIYICELGKFECEKKKILMDTIMYIQAFYGRPVVLYSKINFKDIPDRAYRYDGRNIQIQTGWVLKQLKKNIPSDSQSYIAFSSYDLYPDEDWNFVFGEASLKNRTGVWSIFRNGDPKEDYKLCLRRTIATAVHEIGHTYGMQHCIGYECLMNGSNSMEESDEQVMYLCPQCLNKLERNSNLNIKNLYKNLIKVCEKLGFDIEIEFFKKCLDEI